jgi:hypothetical protein
VARREAVNIIAELQLEGAHVKILHALVMALACVASFQASAQRQPVPVINYENVPISNPTGGRLTAAQVKQAIQSGATAKQWAVEDQGPGRMLATLKVNGKHTVMTQINYTADQFSVVYSDSTNMKYSPGPDGKGVIHPFYNRWVQDLKEAIRTSLVKG